MACRPPQCCSCCMLATLAMLPFPTAPCLLQAEYASGAEATFADLCSALAKHGKWEQLLSATQLKGKPIRYLVVLLLLL